MGCCGAAETNVANFNWPRRMSKSSGSMMLCSYMGQITVKGVNELE